MGPESENGEALVITIAEETPHSYKLHFQSGEWELMTPNLFAPFTKHHVDLSAANSTLNIPLKDLALSYQRSSASALRISIVPKDTAAPRSKLCGVPVKEPSSIGNHFLTRQKSALQSIESNKKMSRFPRKELPAHLFYYYFATYPFS